MLYFPPTVWYKIKKVGCFVLRWSWLECGLRQRDHLIIRKSRLTCCFVSPGYWSWENLIVLLNFWEKQFSRLSWKLKQLLSTLFILSVSHSGDVVKRGGPSIEFEVCLKCVGDDDWRWMKRKEMMIFSYLGVVFPPKTKTRWWVYFFLRIIDHLAW